MAFKFNPFTGTFDLVDDNAGGNAVDPSEIIYPAGEAISALNIVFIGNDQVYKADSSLLHRPIGIALNSGNILDPITIKTFGEWSDPSFLFAANETLFLNGNGMISNSAPTSGYANEIGYSMGLGRIFINIKQPILRG